MWEPVIGSLATATAREWAARLRGLLALGYQRRDAPGAYRWLIQARILWFLLRKYGADPTLDRRAAKGPEREPWVHLLPGGPAPPRRGEAFRGKLAEITRINEEVRAERRERGWVEAEWQAKVMRLAWRCALAQAAEARARGGR